MTPRSLISLLFVLEVACLRKSARANSSQATIRYGLYLISNFESDRRISANGSKYVDAPSPPHPFRPNQVWRIGNAGWGTYTFTNAVTNERILSSESPSWNRTLGCHAKHGYEDQKWYVDHRGFNTWQLRNFETHRRIVAPSGGTLEATLAPGTYDYQRWRFIPCDTLACQEVRGEWVIEQHIFHDGKHTTVEGWEKFDTDEYAEGTLISVATKFRAEYEGGAKDFTGSWAKNMKARTYDSIKTKKARTKTETYLAEDGRYIWTWRWALSEVATGKTNSIMTHYKIQSDTKPRCLPGENIDKIYEVCNIGACLERCAE